MGAEALLEALADAELAWRDVDLLVCAHMYAKTGAGHRIAALLGQTGIPIINVENACSSGGAAVLAARRARSPAATTGGSPSSGSRRCRAGSWTWTTSTPGAARSATPSIPAQFAFAIRRHMHEFGTTERQLALVAEKNHAHSVHNPKAMYRKPIRAEEVLASRAVVDPLRLLMLCTPNEGAAAAVLSLRAGPRRTGARSSARACAPHAARRRRRAHADRLAGRAGRAGHGPRRRRGLRAGRDRAGGSRRGRAPGHRLRAPRSSPPSSSDCAHTGEGGALVESGATRLGGRLPVNPSGGLLSKGEPVGASALGHVYEIANQLRGRCGPRQVQGARTGLTHALGAGGNCSVMVLQRA